MNPPISDITLRDYFAAAALQGIMTQNNMRLHLMDTVAEHAYLIADLMVEARDAPKK